MKPLVILDFDGTFTDAEAEGQAFADAYRRELGSLVGRDVSENWAAAASVLSDPERGWEVSGQVVAPANCDPYIRSTCLAFEVCNQLGLMRTIELRSEVLSAIYAYCYRFTDTVFRPEAFAVLSALAATRVHLWVVTNSDTKVVESKLERLGLAQIPVIGSAKKYVVRDDAKGPLAAVADLKVSGLKRPLKVRRPHYAEVLERLMRDTGNTPATTLVCGDIFELDLALPLALGCRGHLIDRPNTLPYERAALASFGARASSSSSLSPLVEKVEALVG